MLSPVLFNYLDEEIGGLLVKYASDTLNHDRLKNVLKRTKLN